MTDLTMLRIVYSSFFCLLEVTDQELEKIHKDFVERIKEDEDLEDFSDISTAISIWQCYEEVPLYSILDSILLLLSNLSSQEVQVQVVLDQDMPVNISSNFRNTAISFIPHHKNMNPLDKIYPLEYNILEDSSCILIAPEVC